MPTKNSVVKLFSIPQYRRLFDGHLNDLIQSTFNSTYAAPWAAHFTALTGDNLNGLPGYISGRAGTAQASLPFSGMLDDLLSYVLAGDLAVQAAGDTFTVSIDQHLGADDALITVEFSTDLVTWSPATVDQLLSSTNKGDGTVTHVWEGPEPISHAPIRFVRVAVELR